MTAGLIGDFLDGVTSDGKSRTLSGELQRRLYLLTGMAWVWMIENPSEETVRFGQRRLIEDLFQGCWDNPRMLPTREAWHDAETAGPTGEDRRLSDVTADTQPEKLEVWRQKARLICDQVAGMTDLYALHVHGEMYKGGGAPGVLRLTS